MFGDQVKHYPANDCVCLLDSMGTDGRVVNAARVSYDVWIDETQPLSEKDERLIFYLSKHDHVSPFFHPMVCFRLKMPIFVAREWFRHTVGFSRNEVSRRYVTKPVECFLPEMVREKHPQKKQGSKDTCVETNEECLKLMKESMEQSLSTYRQLLERVAAPEVARMVLPQSMMTEFIETASLSAYARLYKLRYAPDAQYEIRCYAEAIGKILEQKFPISWKALTQK